MQKNALPVEEALGDVCAALLSCACAVLVAPPGAGKTTRVPPALLDETWLAGRKIIMLEPRRLAARAAATRMASEFGETIGQTIGLRARLQSRVGPRTRIEVVTEGVFARMILDDPSLDGVGAVIFDEFHERSLDADMGLALALDAQAGLREDLRILVMSATLDGARVAKLLGDAPVIASEGRAFPVETRHVSRDTRAMLEDEVTRVILRALREESGSILAFLPGQREIVRTAERLRDNVRDNSVDIAPLYGAMEREAQDLAVLPAKAGRRKIVLATSIAETSLTIEGVRVVIDSGLARVPRFEPDTGVTRLETVRVSRASADQRRGRAGRTEPGVCYRMWEEAATQALEPFAKPEILSADLSGLLLDLADWGARDASALAWLDPPPPAASAEARALLQRLGALDGEGAITVRGRAMRALPLPPRLAAMMLDAAQNGRAQLAGEIAAVLVERGLGGDAVSLMDRVERLRRDRSPRAKDMMRMAQNWASSAAKSTTAASAQDDDSLEHCGAVLARAWPERIARARGKPGEFLMANGRAGFLETHDTLARKNFLAVAEITGRAGATRILSAAPLDGQTIEQEFSQQIEAVDETVFDRATASVKSRKLRRMGALILNEQPQPVRGADAARILAEGIAGIGIERLPWTKAIKQWRDRMVFLRNADIATQSESDWPDVSDATLAKTAGDWLAPFIEGKSSLAAINADDLAQALHALIDWRMGQRLEKEAPTHFQTPAGSNMALDYETEGGPVLAVRVQELFGLADHPAIAGGKIPLTLHLLSPAHRPVQITRDLPGFWKGSWSEVKAEMKGRYPKHVWPDDPASAAATTRAKPRGT